MIDNIKCVKNVVVTGSASGIGYYIAKQYALSKNYRVFCFDINKVEGIKEATIIEVNSQIE